MTNTGARPAASFPIPGMISCGVIIAITPGRDIVDTNGFDSVKGVTVGRDNDKRELRELKRVVKRAGNKLVRREAKRAIEESPEEAHKVETSYGRLSSSEYNGLDQIP